MSGTRRSQINALLDATECLMFDFDGPLCDVFSGRSAESIARRLEGIAGRHFETDDPLVVMSKCRLVADPAIADRVEDALIADEVDAIESARVNTAGVDAMLAGQRAGRSIAIVSNNSADCVRRFLERYNFANIVSAVVGRRRRRPDLMKPNPWPLQQALTHLSVSSEHAVLIGDSVTDIEASKDGGVSCIALANKSGKREKFVHAGADLIIDDMAELGGVLGSYL